MTLIELTVFIIMLAIGGFVAGVLKPIGGLWLAIPGFIAGFLLIPGLNFTYERYRKIVYCGDELMPPCSCGSKKFNLEVIEDNEFHRVCQTCGRHYDKRKKEVYRFEKEERVPYMHLVKHKGWIDWNSQQIDGSDS